MCLCNVKLSGTSFLNFSYKIENWDVAPEIGPAYIDIECYGWWQGHTKVTLSAMVDESITPRWHWMLWMMTGSYQGDIVMVDDRVTPRWHWVLWLMKVLWLIKLSHHGMLWIMTGSYQGDIGCYGWWQGHTKVTLVLWLMKVSHQGDIECYGWCQGHTKVTPSAMVDESVTSRWHWMLWIMTGSYQDDLECYGWWQGPTKVTLSSVVNEMCVCMFA